MAASLARRLVSLIGTASLVFATACGRGVPDPEPEAPRPPQVAGTLEIVGLREPVSVVRDRWGIPHIKAANLDDLFFAQGFVQAQDRLFQIDLWRRAAQGRLSETLGANYIERDAMTRRIRYRGSIEAEWESYGPDTRRIAAAFTRGINAWVTIAREDPPEEFPVAGWLPELWKPEDLLNRTDAFVASADAQGDLLRARLAAAIGVARVSALFPAEDGQPMTAPAGVDLGAITPILPELLRRVGPPPFFSALAAPVTSLPRREAAGSNAWALAPSRTTTGRPLLAVDPHRSFDLPALRYLVHLEAPGFHVAGATAPWLPGVAIGHNDRIAWGMTAWPADTQDVFVERINPDDPHQVEYQGRWVDMIVELERVHVKGRSEPFVYERLYTRHGVVVGLDRDRNLAYTVQWSGTGPGGASELAAIAIDRAQTWSEFREAAARWKMPTVRFVYADVDGHVVLHRAGLLPVRGASNGWLPAPGWSGEHDWQRVVQAATASNPPANPPPRVPADPLPFNIDIAVAPNDDPRRMSRIESVLKAAGLRSLDDMTGLQLDTFVNPAALLSLLDDRALRPELTTALRELRAWDGRVTPESRAAGLYVAWESAIARLLAERRVPREFVPDVALRIDPMAIVSGSSAAWFDGNSSQSRRQLVADALSAALAAPSSGASALAGPSAHQPREVLFRHPLGIFEDAARRFNVGPFPLPGYPHTVFATDGRVGPSFRAVFDVGEWDRSRVINAPGQSGAPSSAHYDDMAGPWAAGEYVPLPFSDQAVRDAAQGTLTLTPPR